MAVTLLSALGLLLVLTTNTERIIAGHFRDALEALTAAEAGAERALRDLGGLSDWTPALDGVATSGFVDGPPAGFRILPDGSRFDLTAATNIRRCGRPRPCTGADMDAVTDERPWGANNPRWQLYAYGPVTRLLATGTVDSLMYVIVWVGDDPSENDNNPTADGVAPSNPGAGMLTVRAEALGPGGCHKVIEKTVARSPMTASEAGRSAFGTGRMGLRIISWREIR